MMWNALFPTSIDKVMAWASDQPWCRAMAECEQDREWHAEGDVWTHAQMVCAQLSRLDEWPSLTPRQQAILVFTAIFHDAAKPLTSRIDAEGRIASPKHAVKGEYLARRVLRDLGCDLTTREEIARMVRFHGRPAFLLDRDNPNHEVISLSWFVNNRLLYLFAIADTRGRSTGETTRPEENLHFWKLASEEAACFEQPYPFANDHARFLFYRQPEPNLYYIPHEDRRLKVTMMSGLPGSGKDTWLSANRPDLPVVSLDDIRDALKVEATDRQGEVIQFARERCRELLRGGQSFAFSATNLLRQTRRRWIDLFADYGAWIEIVYVEPPMPDILAQNKRRGRSVPERVIHELADKCEPPTWAEAHHLVLHSPDIR